MSGSAPGWMERGSRSVSGGPLDNARKCVSSCAVSDMIAFFFKCVYGYCFFFLRIRIRATHKKKKVVPTLFSEF